MKTGAQRYEDALAAARAIATLDSDMGRIRGYERNHIIFTIEDAVAAERARCLHFARRVQEMLEHGGVSIATAKMIKAIERGDEPRP